MCALLLLDAAKRTDHEFDTPYHSSRQTTRSADNDISKMVKYLIEEKHNRVRMGQISLIDPLVTGMQKLVDGWLKKFLVSSEEFDINTEDEPVNEVELNHELHNAYL